MSRKGGRNSEKGKKGDNERRASLIGTWEKRSGRGESKKQTRWGSEKETQVDGGRAPLKMRSRG
ncbi:hypothetical protein COLO4_06035 [Corchorus olitorius]|uniref:Uncharacterized protein n=1 Tax=Corchorus olitorius TaxID=93759 RepID=A0A1R3KP55_9ROSI|nr:hypothetical protein COLO4_06035 [Corchorus olitorius]